MMKVMRLVDDTNMNNAPSVKMTCDCGWVEKAFANRDARTRAERHLKDKHNGGLMKYMGHSYEI